MLLLVKRTCFAFGVLDAHAKEIRKLIEKGHTQEAIAERFGVSLTTVFRWLRSRELCTKGLQPFAFGMLDAHYKELRDLTDQGQTQAAIAKRFGVSQRTVGRWLQSKGLMTKGILQYHPGHPVDQ